MKTSKDERKDGSVQETTYAMTIHETMLLIKEAERIFVTMCFGELRPLVEITKKEARSLMKSYKPYVYEPTDIGSTYIAVMLFNNYPDGKVGDKCLFIG